MKTISIKRNGKVLDMFDVLGIIRSVKAFRVFPENEEKENYHVLFFSLQVENKYLYLAVIEPYTANTEKRIIRIRQLGLELETKLSPEAIVKYTVKNIPLDEDTMLFLLLDKAIDDLDWELEEEDDIVFFE